MIKNINVPRFITGTLLCLVLFSLTWAVKYDTKKSFISRNFPAGKEFSKSTIHLPDDRKAALVNKWKWKGDIRDISLLMVRDEGGSLLGTVYFTTVYATEHECVHHLAIALDPSGTVSEVVITELFCERAMPVTSKSFLGQFRKKTMKPLRLDVDINGVTEATMSCEVIVEAVNTAMAGYSEYLENQKGKQ